MSFLRHEDGAESGKRQAGQEAFPVAGRNLQYPTEPEEIDVTVEAPVCRVMPDKSGTVAHELKCDRTLAQIFRAIVPDRGRLNRGR